MKMRREKISALLVGIFMVLTLCMGGFVTTVDAAGIIVETGNVSQDEDVLYFITIPEGPEVEIKLMWEEPKHDDIDIDFAVGGVMPPPWEFPWPWIGGSFRNPEIAYLSDITDGQEILVVVNGWYVPGDGVDYRLEVTFGSDVIPEPYAESGGQTVGDLTSFHHASRAGNGHSDKQGANSWLFHSNPLRQSIMGFVSFWNFFISKMHYGLYEYGAWAGPAYYADDPLLVGAMAWSWPMDLYTREEAEAEMETMNVQYKVDNIPLEELGHTTEKRIRPDNEAREWYYRWPAAIFKPGELYDLLPYNADGLHALQLEYFDPDIQSNLVFQWYFYLL
ncbi:MAG: hypothetical protein ACXAB5_01015 [Candidatus Thorarchaeota archaeon]